MELDGGAGPRPLLPFESADFGTCIGRVARLYAASGRDPGALEPAELERRLFPGRALERGVAGALDLVAGREGGAGFSSFARVAPPPTTPALLYRLHRLCCGGGSVAGYDADVGILDRAVRPHPAPGGGERLGFPSRPPEPAFARRLVRACAPALGEDEAATIEELVGASIALAGDAGAAPAADATELRPVLGLCWLLDPSRPPGEVWAELRDAHGFRAARVALDPAGRARAVVLYQPAPSSPGGWLFRCGVPVRVG